MEKTYTTQSIYRQDALEQPNQVKGNQPENKKFHVSKFSGLPAIKTPLTKKPVPAGLSARITDGTITALAALTLTLALDLLIYPIQALGRTEGLFIYFFIILALGLYSLDRSTAARVDLTDRALWGMAGGLFLWHAFWMTQLFANFNMESPGPMLILILVTMVGLTLWRPVLPLGVKFFLLSFLASWYTRIFILEIFNLSANGYIPSGLFYLVGFLALVTIFVCIGYLVYKAELRIQRFWIALVMWQVGLVAISVAFGTLF